MQFAQNRSRLILPGVLAVKSTEMSLSLLHRSLAPSLPRSLSLPLSLSLFVSPPLSISFAFILPLNSACVLAPPSYVSSRSTVVCLFCLFDKMQLDQLANISITKTPLLSAHPNPDSKLCPLQELNI